MNSYKLNFPWRMPKNAVVEVVGIPALVFENPEDYDQRQYWLPFMNIIIAYEKPIVEKKKQPEQLKADIQKQALRKYASIPEECRQLFAVEKDVPQLPLPFDGWRKVRSAYWKKLTAAKHPAWEKINGEVLRIVFNVEHLETVREFCELNCLGRYLVKPGKLYLELKIDYVKAQIAFGK